MTGKKAEDIVTVVLAVIGTADEPALAVTDDVERGHASH